MSFASIKALIAAEQSTCEIFGQVTGTPRTYGGSRRNDDIWRACVRDGKWTGLDGRSTPLDVPVFMTFSFRLNPRSTDYGGNVAPNGRDVDTMVIGALLGLTPNSVRPSLGLLSRASLLWGYAATKELTENDDDTGVDITVSLRSAPALSDFRALLPASDLTVKVAHGVDRKQMARAAVESHNVNQRFFPACSPISMAVAFANTGGHRNVTSDAQIEALIDGMGAAIVGERRLFDAPRGRYLKESYHFDDSCIFSLLIGRFDLGSDPGIDAIVDIFDSSRN